MPLLYLINVGARMLSPADSLLTRRDAAAHNRHPASSVMQAPDNLNFR